MTLPKRKNTKQKTTHGPSNCTKFHMTPSFWFTVCALGAVSFMVHAHFFRGFTSYLYVRYCDLIIRARWLLTTLTLRSWGSHLHFPSISVHFLHYVDHIKGKISNVDCMPWASCRQATNSHVLVSHSFHLRCNIMAIRMIFHLHKQSFAVVLFLPATGISCICLQDSSNCCYLGLHVVSKIMIWHHGSSKQVRSGLGG